MAVVEVKRVQRWSFFGAKKGTFVVCSTQSLKRPLCHTGRCSSPLSNHLHKEYRGRKVLSLGNDSHETLMMSR
jgi:hypothetical protein